MDYISLYSNRCFYPETINPDAAMTAKQLIEALSLMPENAPVFCSYGGREYALHNPPMLLHREK